MELPGRILANHYICNKKWVLLSTGPCLVHSWWSVMARKRESRWFGVPPSSQALADVLPRIASDLQTTQLPWVETGGK